MYVCIRAKYIYEISYERYILTFTDSQSSGPQYSQQRTRQHVGIIFKFNIQAASRRFKFTVLKPESTSC